MFPNNPQGFLGSLDPSDTRLYDFPNVLLAVSRDTNIYISVMKDEQGIGFGRYKEDKDSITLFCEYARARITFDKDEGCLVSKIGEVGLYTESKIEYERINERVQDFAKKVMVMNVLKALSDIDL